MRRALIRFGLALVLVALTTLVVLLATGWPPLTEVEIRQAVFSTIERESPEAFLVTGSLEITVTTTIEDSRVLLPGLIGLNLGTTRATIRVPGRVSYGFFADSLRPAMVTFTDRGVVELQLPALEVYSVEPDLTALEVETERGWARLPGGREAAERQAIAVIEAAFRRQAQGHLASSFQPRINSARALERVLSPALRGLGMSDPRFRVRLGEDLVVEPSG